MRKTVAPVQTFGEFVKCKRLSLDLTQSEVAIKVGTTQGCICKIENNEIEPSVTLALKVCNVLDLDINDFAKQHI